MSAEALSSLERLTVGSALQCANFVRAHKLWRHVTYPGGVVPQNEVVTQMQRLSVQQDGAAAPNGAER